MTPDLPLFDLPINAPPSVPSCVPPADQPIEQPEPTEQPEISAFQKLEQLSRQIREMETAGRPDKERISSGCHTMDRHLPGGGYARGILGRGTHEKVDVSRVAWMPVIRDGVATHDDELNVERAQ